MILLFSILACEWITPYLEEVREDPTKVVYAGMVYETPPIVDVEPLEIGSVRFYKLDGSPLAEAIQPNSGTLGYWRSELPIDTEFQLLIESDVGYPTLWRGVSPSGYGTWFSGALFGYSVEFTDQLLGEIAGSEGVELIPLEDGSVGHLWGSFTNPDDAAIADMSLSDGAGNNVTLFGYEMDEDGLLIATDVAPIDFFFAFNIEPGTVSLSLLGGESPHTIEYYTVGGEMISPWWLEVP
jgi:hypothetical protein